MSLGMEHAMEDGYSPLGGLKTVPCDRWSEDSRVGSGFVCHAQQRADRKQLRTQVNEIRRSIDCRGLFDTRCVEHEPMAMPPRA
jgi:hypothetical protein